MPPLPAQTPYRRIAAEEAFATPELMAAYRQLLADGSYDDPGFVSLVGYHLTNPSQRTQQIVDRLQNIGERRLQDMDDTGIAMQILSLTSPGFQVFDADKATWLARDANDQVAEAIRKWPTRFAGLAAVAPQDPNRAAQELEYGVRTLGLKGAIINSHTRGEYLDDPKYWAIFEAAEHLGVPIYLHPNTPPKSMIGPMVDAGVEYFITYLPRVAYDPKPVVRFASEVIPNVG